MNPRRHFLKNMSILAGGSVLLSSWTVAHKKIKNVGIQLYTFRTEMLADARGTLKQIAALGIKQVESARSAKGNYYGLTPKEMKQTCADLGMTLCSGHIQIDNQWQQTMDQAAETGQEYLICASLPSRGQTVDNYKKCSDTFNKCAEECKKLHIRFGYHNHDAEFAQENGQVLYDVLLANTDPDLVTMEMDLGWVVAAGKDPFDYFNKYPGRFPLWHLKDMDMQKKRSTEFGKGSLDVVKILKHQKQSGMKYFFVEQEEYTKNALESMKENMAYLGKLRI